MRIGIDLGTYNSSAAAAFDGGRRIEMVQSRDGRTRDGCHFPSFVGFDRAGAVQTVGIPARREITQNPDLVVWGAKRLVGISFHEARANGELERFAYPIVESSGGAIEIPIGKERYRPQDVIRSLFERIKEDAEDPELNPALGGEIDSVVVSVPADFRAWRVNAIVAAAEAAGFRDVQTIAEPTAAAICYGLDIESESTVLTFDLGAGTLDVTLLSIVRDGDVLMPGELCTSGHEAFGGIDMDSLLLEHLTREHRVRCEDPRAMARFREDVESAKIRLSERRDTYLELPDFREAELTRDDLEGVLRPVLEERCRGPIELALQVSGRDAAEIDHVLFVGGPTRMPCVREVVFDILRRQGARREVLRELRRPREAGGNDTEAGGVDPMSCVAMGASLKAANVGAPAIQALAEGYGTLVNGDQYLTILEPGSTYPIRDDVSIIHGNPSARRVPVSLVSKTPVAAATRDAGVRYEYRHLGIFHLAVTPDGQPPAVSVSLEIDENKACHARLRHEASPETVTYRALDSVAGHVIRPREGDPRQSAPSGIPLRAPSSGPGTPSVEEWDEKSLENAMNAAKAVLALCSSGTARRGPVADLRAELQRTLRQAARGGGTSVCPRILNLTQSLLGALREAGVVDEERYGSAKLQLDRIG